MQINNKIKTNKKMNNKKIWIYQTQKVAKKIKKRRKIKIIRFIIMNKVRLKNKNKFSSKKRKQPSNKTNNTILILIQ